MPVCCIVASVILVSIIALQYPLSSSFPIGGDAPYYIIVSKEILAGLSAPQTALHSILVSWYPLFNILFTTTALLPLSWADRFIWSMAAGHIVTALSLGWLLYRLSGWRAASAGIVFWSLTIVSITPHVESGTVAQLWSLAFFFLFLERWFSGSFYGTLSLFILTLLTHFLAGIVAVTAIICSVPLLMIASRQSNLLIAQKRIILLLKTLLALIGILGLYVMTKRFYIFSSLHHLYGTFDVRDLFYSHFGPLLLLAVVGVVYLAGRREVNGYRLSIILGTLTATSLLALNGQLGAGVLAGRFKSYFIGITVLLAAYAFPRLIRTLAPSRSVRILITVLMMTVLWVPLWHYNKPVYAFYESPSRYARLHPDEFEALQWLEKTDSKPLFIMATTTNRHTEWIPALTKHRFAPVTTNDPLFQMTDEKLSEYVRSRHYAYIVFFKHREGIYPSFTERPDLFPVVFENRGSIIFSAL